MGGEMALAEAAVPSFDMGRVVTRTFSVIGHNVAAFGLLSLVVAIPLIVVNLGMSGFSAGLFRGGQFNLTSDGFYVITQIIYFLSLSVMQAAIVHATVLYLNGRKSRPMDSLFIGLAALLQLILITLLVLLGITVGIVLLVIPGLILMVMWSVAVPACIVDRTGVTGSLSRSRELTRGHRWAIFGLLVAFTILIIVISVSLAALVGSVAIPISPEDKAAVYNPSFAQAAYAVITAIISSVIGSALTASIYYELRVLKDGIGPEALAAVFD